MKISAKLIFFVSTFMIGSLCSLLIIPTIQKLSFFLFFFVFFLSDRVIASLFQSNLVYEEPSVSHPCVKFLPLHFF